MAVVLRLSRTGKRSMPMYRVIAVEKRQKRDAKPIEILGTYIPSREQPTIKIDQKRIDHWQSKGAIVSVGLQKILPK